ncbi:uncharacterized protein ACO6RY_05880 [Pungitius sinensis]
MTNLDLFRGAVRVVFGPPPPMGPFPVGGRDHVCVRGASPRCYTHTVPFKIKSPARADRCSAPPGLTSVPRARTRPPPSAVHVRSILFRPRCNSEIIAFLFWGFQKKLKLGLCAAVSQTSRNIVSEVSTLTHFNLDFAHIFSAACIKERVTEFYIIAEVMLQCWHCHLLTDNESTAGLRLQGPLTSLS